ncbi:Alpha-copaene synthase [Linum perenne]
MWQNLLINKWQSLTIPLKLILKSKLQRLEVETQNSHTRIMCDSDHVVAIQNNIVEASPVSERVSANFHKSIWGQHFMSTDLADQMSKALGEAELRSEYEALMEEVRKMLTAEESMNNKAVIQGKLRLLDAIQRLGVGYLFEKEIEGLVQKVYDVGDEFVFQMDFDLYHEALRFRLLRQHGLALSPDGFKNFKDKEGKFSESLASDEEGLLSLYEAAHMAVHGEDILDEARAFATEKLDKSIIRMNNQNRNPSSFENLPVWKCAPRTLTRNYIDFYSEDNTTVDSKLLRFAKLDFNMLQKFHQQELREITEWWGNLEVEIKFPYARDRVVECYYWMHAVYFEPKYHLARMLVTKMISTLSLLDDTFDNFATYEEVDVLTQAIQRFDTSSLESLPDTMKNIYQVLIDLYDELEAELAKIGPTFGVDYVKEELKKLCRCYLAEIKWRTQDHVPTVEEHKKAAYVTSGTPIIIVGAFLGMEQELATREAYEWVSNNPKIVEAASLIGRLHNDLVSFKFERNKKHVASSIDCYMKELNVSEEEAIEFIREEISKAWKDIAESCHKPTPVPVALMDRILNFARSINVIYENGDGYTNSHLMKSEIASLFVDPVPLL